MKCSLIILAIFCLSCSGNKNLINKGYEIIRFKDNAVYGPKLIKQDYILEVPKGGILKKGQYDFTGDFHVEYRIIYPDSAIIYIGNDTWNCSILNVVNRVSSGINPIKKQRQADSLFLEGVQKDNKFWKENILGEQIMAGYLNVKQAEKLAFDKAVSSVRQYKK